MSEDDRALLRDAIRAAVEGPYFPDWEFGTLMGLSRTEMAAVAEAWPEPADDIREDGVRTQQLAVKHALNNLIGYPHRDDDDLRARLSVGRDALRILFDRWKHGRTI